MFTIAVLAYRFPDIISGISGMGRTTGQEAQDLPAAPARPWAAEEVSAQADAVLEDALAEVLADALAEAASEGAVGVPEEALAAGAEVMKRF